MRKTAKKLSVLFIVRAAVTAALYFVLTVSMQPIAFGPLQFRVAEALTLLPLIMPESVVGLTLGCLLANLFSPYGWYDIVFGTLATLTAALATFGIGKLIKSDKIILKCIIGALPPIIFNALILPTVWLFFSGDEAFWINVGIMLATQTGSVLVIGTPLIIGVNKLWAKKGQNY